MNAILIALALAWNGGTGAEALQRARHPMAVSGLCLSACALSWAINPRGCWKPGAKFGFHAARDPGTGEIMPAANAWWRDQLPANIRPHVRLDADMTFLDTADLQRIVPERKCR